ncbi:hypothetical protein HYC85_030371 [Camellia sinensis]|uniref:Uncharacterized protein n=1 Tax=Camellia sinensis TaxID=4442 RepID=A0A7J7G0K3_CAMSI|nr:hypothetical protein HYC85_030371 [Camellia sinensis]
MRNKPFPFYEDWLILFGNDRATGELAEDPTDAITAMEKEDANATTKDGEPSHVEQFSMNIGDTDYSMSTAGNVPNHADSTKTRKKRARPSKGIPTELSEMAKNLRLFIKNTNTMMVEIAHRIGYSHDLSQQRRLVLLMDKLKMVDPCLEYSARAYWFCQRLVDFPNERWWCNWMCSKSAADIAWRCPWLNLIEMSYSITRYLAAWRTRELLAPVPSFSYALSGECFAWLEDEAQVGSTLATEASTSTSRGSKST